MRIQYQAFSILGSNASLLESKIVGWLANGSNVDRPGALFALILSLQYSSCPMAVVVGSQSLQRLKTNFEAIQQLVDLPTEVTRGFEHDLADEAMQYEEEVVLHGIVGGARLF